MMISHTCGARSGWLLGQSHVCCLAGEHPGEEHRCRCGATFTLLQESVMTTEHCRALAEGIYDNMPVSAVEIIAAVIEVSDNTRVMTTEAGERQIAVEAGAWDNLRDALSRAGIVT